jgi:aminoglycoside 6'-N-acetyltransferase
VQFAAVLRRAQDECECAARFGKLTGNPAEISLRLATPEDRFLIRRWLSAGHAQAWWGDAASAEAEFTMAMDSAAALARIIELGRVAVGYAHAVEMGLWAERPPLGVPAGSWDVDCLVAPSSGDATATVCAALTLLTAEVFATTLAVACCALVSLTNEAAARAYEHAGFRWQRILQEPLHGPSWLMLKERPQPAR